MTATSLQAADALARAVQDGTWDDLHSLAENYQAARIAELQDVDSNLGAARHRASGPTETAAADVALPKAGTLRWKVIDALFVYPNGLTDQEIAEEAGAYLYSIAPRRTELVRLGWVQDSGKTRATDRGHEAVVWRLTDAGAARLGAHYDGTG